MLRDYRKIDTDYIEMPRALTQIIKRWQDDTDYIEMKRALTQILEMTKWHRLYRDEKMTQII